MKPIRLPPGPPGHALIGSLPLSTRDPLKLLSQWAQRYGDIFYYRAFGIRVYFLNNPEAIESVLVTQSANFIKGRGLQVNRRLFGNGLLTSEGEAWWCQRRVCQPAFQRERIAGMASVMSACTRRMLQGWRDGEVRDVHRDMMHLTLEIVARSLFEVDIGERIPEISNCAQPITRFNTRGRILLPLATYLPTPANIRYRLAVRKLDRLVMEIILERRAHGASGRDLLSALLQARDEEGRGFSKQQLRDEVMTLMLAGHETTALALCWTFYLLALNPPVEQRLVEEIDRQLKCRPPGFSDLARLDYAEKVIRESLRLYPPAYAMARIATRSCQVLGYEVPRGASIVMSPWVSHRDPRFFDNPEEFNPERWTSDFSKALPSFAYFPFGGGPRVCIGASFAMTEAALVLATILQKFRLELCPGQKVAPVAGITLRPQNGLNVRLRERPGSASAGVALQNYHHT